MPETFTLHGWRAGLNYRVEDAASGLVGAIFVHGSGYSMLSQSDPLRW